MVQVENHLRKSNESHKEFRKSLDRLEKGQQTLQSDVRTLQSIFDDLVERQLRGDIRRH